MKKILSAGMATAALLFVSVSAIADQSDGTNAPSPNPTYQEGTPLYSAQKLTGSEYVFDSYWTYGNWKIHCSQTEFCYIHLPIRATRDYEGGQVHQPLQWEKDKVVEHSLAFGIKGQTIRTAISVPFWTFQGKSYTDDYAAYDQTGRPDITSVYIMDASAIVGSQHHGKKIPLSLDIWGDWEPEAKPLLQNIIGHLYHNAPKDFDVRVDVDNQPAISLVFDVSGFKEAYDQMQKERIARFNVLKEGKKKFAAWPSTVTE